jgi:hypothetical protein
MLKSVASERLLQLASGDEDLGFPRARRISRTPAGFHL